MIGAVIGEPGIGKSRLLTELSTRAEARGHLVLASRAAEFLRALPFGVLAAAFDDYLTSLDLVRLGLDERSYPELATAFPAFVPLSDGGRPALQAERFQTHRAVRALLQALGRPQPLVVILDDVHWADPASVELLTHLLVHPPSAPVLIALGYRPKQAAPQLRGALAAAAQEGIAERIELGPLTGDEVMTFVGDEATESTRAELHRDSGGNPFYLEQLLRSAGLARPAQPLRLTLDVPPAVAAAMAAELTSLQPTALTLLQGAAVVGDPFDDDLAAIAAGGEERDTLMWLDELLERDLIRTTLAPRRFRFRHPIVRRAIYESAAPGWRLGAHARVVTVLTEQGSSAQALAQHVERSARRGDQAAIKVLVEAAGTAEMRSPATAARWFDAALRLLPDGKEALSRRLELLGRVATAHGVAGHYEESRAALCRLLELLPEHTEGRAGLVAFCAAVERLMGRFDDARNRLMRGLAEIQSGTSADAVALRLELAIDAFVCCDFMAMHRWAQEALSSTEFLGEPLLEACAAAMVVIARHNLVLPCERHLERARSLVDASTDERLAGRLDAATWLSFAEMSCERYDDAYEHGCRVVRIARETGRGQYIAMTTISQLYALMSSGRLREMEELAEAAIDSFRAAGEPALAEALCCRGFVRAHKGDLAGAIRDGEEALEMHRGRGRQPLLASATAIFLGSILVDAGEPVRARNLLSSMLGGPTLPLAERKGRGVAVEILTRAELDLGNLEAAEGWARWAEATDGFGEWPVHSAPVQRAVALVLLARGEAHAAAELALAVAEKTAAAGSPLEAGRSRLLAGRALSQAGNRGEARRQFERAEAELAECGASVLADQAGAELRRLGFRRRSPEPRGHHGLDSLTDRERLIADLVQNGRTNRQIADECYLSVKTVERHVAHLFDKLGVTSRAGVAALMAREDRGRPTGLG